MMLTAGTGVFTRVKPAPQPPAAPLLRLAIAPVPEPLWRVNLRHRLTAGGWKRLRARVIEERGLVCGTCGKIEREARRISAHEEWAYDTSTSPAVARLLGVRLSCWLCHAVEHIGHTHQLTISGAAPYALEAAIAHFCSINGVDRAAFEAHKDAAFAEWRRRNALEWRVDWGPFPL